MDLLNSLPLQQAERYSHELVTWLCGILDENQSDEQVGRTRSKVDFGKPFYIPWFDTFHLYHFVH